MTALRSSRLKPRPRRPTGAGGSRVPSGSHLRPEQVDHERDQHADARGAEAVMPAVDLTERAGDQRRRDHGGIDEQKVDLERIGAPQIARRVERTDLAGDVALEAADPGQKAQQRDQERHVEGHQEMPGRHQQRADRDRASPAEPAVGDEAARDRGQVDEAGVEAENRRGERDRRQRPAVGSARTRRGTSANPAMCSMCPGSSSWRTMYSTRSVCMP